MQKPFNIPAINNHLGALCQHLNINFECDIALDAIEQRHTTGDIHTYIHQGVVYYVGSNSQKLIGNKAISFNSSLWVVLQEDENAPYMRFIDKKVSAQLKSKLPHNHSLEAINQREQKALLRAPNGQLVVYKYTAHLPNDISSYHFLGSIEDGMREINATFCDSFTARDSDEVLA